MAQKSKVPAQVLVRAKQIVTSVRKPAVEPLKARKLSVREKLVKGLQKLHPMD